MYVQDTESEYNTTFLIECKFWNKPVNQETAHAFNTVIHDAGANFGFIVSKQGFQSGCYDAATKTNIKLVSLEELERKFYNKWQIGMAKKYMPFADRLFPYWDYPGKPAKRAPLNWNTKVLLNETYNPFILPLTSTSRLFSMIAFFISSRIWLLCSCIWHIQIVINIALKRHDFFQPDLSTQTNDPKINNTIKTVYLMALIVY